MTKEEWYRSEQFIINRFLGNMSSDIGHKCQEIRDVFELLQARNPGCVIMDRFYLVERQLRIVSLEGDNLRRVVADLVKMFEPKSFDEKSEDGNQDI